MTERFTRFHENRNYESMNIDFDNDDDDEELLELEQASMAQPIPEDNLGYQLLQKQGWSSGKGLGRSEQGRLDPLPIVRKDDIMGIGRLEMEMDYAEETTEKRRVLETEKEDSVELQQKYKAAQEKQKAVQEGLASLKANFFCDLCEKQYYKYQEFDNHINSYDHAHKQRLKELKLREFGRTVGVKWRKEDRRKEIEARRLQELAEIRAQAAAMRGPIEMGTGEKFIPGGGFKEIDKKKTCDKSSESEDPESKIDDPKLVEQTKSTEDKITSSEKTDSVCNPPVPLPGSPSKDDVSASDSNPEIDQNKISNDNTSSDLDRTSGMDESEHTEERHDNSIEDVKDDVEKSVSHKGSDLYSPSNSQTSSIEAAEDASQDQDVPENELFGHIEETMGDPYSPSDLNRQITEEVESIDEELNPLIEATTFFSVDDINLPPLPGIPSDTESKAENLNETDAETNYVHKTDDGSESNTDKEEVLTENQLIIDLPKINKELYPKSMVLLGKALARKRLMAFSQPKMSTLSSSSEANILKSGSLSFSLSKKGIKNVGSDVVSAFKEEDEESQQSTERITKEDTEIEGKSKKENEGDPNSSPRTELYPSHLPDAFTSKTKFDFLTFVKTKMMGSSEESVTKSDDAKLKESSQYSDSEENEKKSQNKSRKSEEKEDYNRTDSKSKYQRKYDRNQRSEKDRSSEEKIKGPDYRNTEYTYRDKNRRYRDSDRWSPENRRSTNNRNRRSIDRDRNPGYFEKNWRSKDKYYNSKSSDRYQKYYERERYQRSPEREWYQRSDERDRYQRPDDREKYQRGKFQKSGERKWYQSSEEKELYGRSEEREKYERSEDSEKYQRSVEREVYQRSDEKYSKSEKRKSYQMSEEKRRLKEFVKGYEYLKSEERETYQGSKEREGYQRSEEREGYRKSEERDKYPKSEERERYRRSEEKEGFEISEEREGYQRSEEKEGFEISEEREEYQRSEEKEGFEISEEREGYQRSEEKERYQNPEEMERHQRLEESEGYQKIEDKEKHKKSEKRKTSRWSSEKDSLQKSVDKYQDLPEKSKSHKSFEGGDKSIKEERRSRWSPEKESSQKSKDIYQDSSERSTSHRSIESDKSINSVERDHSINSVERDVFQKPVEEDSYQNSEGYRSQNSNESDRFGSSFDNELSQKAEESDIFERKVYLKPVEKSISHRTVRYKGNILIDKQTKQSESPQIASVGMKDDVNVAKYFQNFENRSSSLQDKSLESKKSSFATEKGNLHKQIKVLGAQNIAKNFDKNKPLASPLKDSTDINSKTLTISTENSPDIHVSKVKKDTKMTYQKLDEKNFRTTFVEVACLADPKMPAEENSIIKNKIENVPCAEVSFQNTSDCVVGHEYHKKGTSKKHLFQIKQESLFSKSDYDIGVNELILKDNQTTSVNKAKVYECGTFSPVASDKGEVKKKSKKERKSSSRKKAKLEKESIPKRTNDQDVSIVRSLTPEIEGSSSDESQDQIGESSKNKDQDKKDMEKLEKVRTKNLKKKYLDKDDSVKKSSIQKFVAKEEDLKSSPKSVSDVKTRMKSAESKMLKNQKVVTQEQDLASSPGSSEKKISTKHSESKLSKKRKASKLLTKVLKKKLLKKIFKAGCDANSSLKETIRAMHGLLSKSKKSKKREKPPSSSSSSSSKSGSSESSGSSSSSESESDDTSSSDTDSSSSNTEAEEKVQKNIKSKQKLSPSFVERTELPPILPLQMVDSPNVEVPEAITPPVYSSSDSQSNDRYGKVSPHSFDEYDDKDNVEMDVSGDVEEEASWNLSPDLKSDDDFESALVQTVNQDEDALKSIEKSDEGVFLSNTSEYGSNLLEKDTCVKESPAVKSELEENIVESLMDMDSPGNTVSLEQDALSEFSNNEQLKEMSITDHFPKEDYSKNTLIKEEYADGDKNENISIEGKLMKSRDTHESKSKKAKTNEKIKIQSFVEMKRSKTKNVIKYTYASPSLQFCCNRKCGDFVCIKSNYSSSKYKEMDCYEKVGDCDRKESDWNRKESDWNKKDMDIKKESNLDKRESDLDKKASDTDKKELDTDKDLDKKASNLGKTEQIVVKKELDSDKNRDCDDMTGTVGNMTGLEALKTSYGQTESPPAKSSKRRLDSKPDSSVKKKHRSLKSDLEFLNKYHKPLIKSSIKEEPSAAVSVEKPINLPVAELIVPKVKSKWDTDSDSNSEMEWSPQVKDSSNLKKTNGQDAPQSKVISNDVKPQKVSTPSTGNNEILNEPKISKSQSSKIKSGVAGEKIKFSNDNMKTENAAKSSPQLAPVTMTTSAESAEIISDAKLSEDQAVIEKDLSALKKEINEFKETFKSVGSILPSARNSAEDFSLQIKKEPSVSPVKKSALLKDMSSDVTKLKEEVSTCDENQSGDLNSEYDEFLKLLNMNEPEDSIQDRDSFLALTQSHQLSGNQLNLDLLNKLANSPKYELSQKDIGVAIQRGRSLNIKSSSQQKNVEMDKETLKLQSHVSSKHILASDSKQVMVKKSPSKFNQSPHQQDDITIKHSKKIKTTEEDASDAFTNSNSKFKQHSNDPLISAITDKKIVSPCKSSKVGSLTNVNDPPLEKLVCAITPESVPLKPMTNTELPHALLASQISPSKTHKVSVPFQDVLKSTSPKNQVDRSNVDKTTPIRPISYPIKTIKLSPQLSESEAAAVPVLYTDDSPVAKSYQNPPDEDEANDFKVIHTQFTNNKIISLDEFAPPLGEAMSHEDNIHTSSESLAGDASQQNTGLLSSSMSEENISDRQQYVSPVKEKQVEITAASAVNTMKIKPTSPKTYFVPTQTQAETQSPYQQPACYEIGNEISQSYIQYIRQLEQLQAAGYLQQTDISFSETGINENMSKINESNLTQVQLAPFIPPQDEAISSTGNGLQLPNSENNEAVSSSSAEVARAVNISESSPDSMEVSGHDVSAAGLASEKTEGDIKKLTFSSSLVAASPTSTSSSVPKTGILVQSPRDSELESKKKSVTFADGIPPIKDVFVGGTASPPPPPPPPKERRHKVKVKHLRKAERSSSPPPPPPPPPRSPPPPPPPPRKPMTAVVMPAPQTVAVDPYQQMHAVQQMPPQYATVGQIQCSTNPQVCGYSMPYAYSGGYPLYTAAPPQTMPPQYAYNMQPPHNMPPNMQPPHNMPPNMQPTHSMPPNTQVYMNPPPMQVPYTYSAPPPPGTQLPGYPMPQQPPGTGHQQ